MGLLKFSCYYNIIKINIANSQSLNYIKSLKPYAIFSAILFALAILNGYLIVARAPNVALGIMQNLQEAFEPFLEIEGLELMFAILINNAIKSLFAAYAAIITVGFAPLAFLWINGIVAGVVASILYFDGQFTTFFVGILPHGIFEIPALILSSAVGFRLAKYLFFPLSPKDKGTTKIVSRKKIFSLELKNSLFFFTKVIIPLLIIAAIVETFITPLLLIA